MSLRKPPTTTTPLLDANRRNALKSTGPRTRRGKAIAARNSYYHGAYAKPDRQTRADMTQLGDDFDLLARLYLDLARAWQPQDAMQALIVSDLAKLYWKKVHLERTVLISRLAEMKQAEVTFQLHQIHPDGQDDPLAESDVEYSGYRGTLGSLRAMDESLRLLKKLYEVVQQRDWTADINGIAALLYGRHPTPKGREILNHLAVLAEVSTERDPGAEASACSEVSKMILDEEATVLIQQVYLRRERQEEFRETIGSRWLPTSSLWGIVLEQDAQLDRMIEAKTKLLIRLQGLRPIEPGELPEEGACEPGQSGEEKETELAPKDGN